MIKYARVGSKDATRCVTVYCGRKFAGHEASPLGNPYYADPDKPGATLPDYRRWLYRHLKAANSPQMAELDRIIDLETRHSVVALTCFCKTAETCHCSVISKAIAWRKTERATKSQQA